MILNSAKNMMIGTRKIERAYIGHELIWKNNQPTNLFNMQLIPSGASCVIGYNGDVNPSRSCFWFDKQTGVVFANYSIYGKVWYFNIPAIRLRGTYTLLADYAAFDENISKSMRFTVSDRSDSVKEKYCTLSNYKEYETLGFVFTIEDEGNYYISVQPNTGAHYTDSNHRVKNIRLYEGDVLTKL